MDRRHAKAELLKVLPGIGDLLRALPLESSMPELHPKSPQDGRANAAAREFLATEPAASRPEIQAGVWLYLDALHVSHSISQGIHGPTGAAWHAIMHRREGDFWNSKYWWRQCLNHPFLTLLERFDPFAFVDQVEAAGSDGLEALVEIQRDEWLALMLWCARQAVDRR